MGRGTGLRLGLMAAMATFAVAAPAWGVTGDFNADGVDDLVIGSPFESTGDDQNAGQVDVIYGPVGKDAEVQHWDQESTDIEGIREDFDNFGEALAVGRFNCDGFDDLAIASPGEEVGMGAFSAGAVNVIYGSASGLIALNDQILQQGVAPVGETAELSDQFGDELAAGDFNGDGCDELAIGVPFEGDESGIVHVLTGTVTGLQSGGILEQGSGGLPDTAEDGDFFGIGLATGNFIGDAREDLAVGSQSEVPPGGGSGAVHVIPGAPAGLIAANASFIYGNSAGIPGPGDGAFGRVLAAGDVGRGPESDLLVGVPFQGVNGKNAGAVVIIFGGDNGAKRYTQKTKGIPGNPGNGDGFGLALKAGDVGKSSVGDAIIGVPDDRFVEEDREGVVHVLFGGANGPKGKGSRYLHQNVKGIPSKPEEDDRFGWSLATGDFGKGSRQDVAIGTAESFGATQQAGTVHLLFQKAKGLTTNGDRFLRHGKAPLGGEDLAADLFSVALAP